MERHIGTWRNESSGEDSVSELIIDGNHIEFYQRGTFLPIYQAHISCDLELGYEYKVVTTDVCEHGKYNTLNNSSSYKVLYVFQQNCNFQQGYSIEGIMSASFIIPEIIEWLKVSMIKWEVILPRLEKILH